MIVLSKTEDRMIVSSFLWTTHRGWRTDGQTESQLDHAKIRSVYSFQEVSRTLQHSWDDNSHSLLVNAF